MTLALASSLIAVIVIVALLVLFAIVLNVSFLRARRAARMHEALAVGEETGEVPSEAPAAPAAPKAQKIVTRRDFFRKSWLASLTLFGVQFGAASVAFLWPNLKGGFGSVFTAGTVADIKGEIDATGNTDRIRNEHDEAGDERGRAQRGERSQAAERGERPPDSEHR